MIRDVKTTFEKSHGTILEDMIGAVALVVILFGGLAVPALL